MGSRIHMTIISTPFHSRVSVTLGVTAFMFVLLLLAGCATAPVQQVRLFNPDCAVKDLWSKEREKKDKRSSGLG